MTQSQFSIRNDIQEIINIGQFRLFAKGKGVNSQGNKNNLVRNITLAVRNSEITEQEARFFLKEQIWYGKNKHHYYVEVDGDSLDKFKNTETMLEYFSNRGINPFNNIDKIFLPEGVSLSRFEYETDPENDSLVNKIFIGFTEKNYLQRFDGQSAVFEPVNVYICSEIDLINNVLLIRIRNRSQLKPKEDVTVKTINSVYLAKKYMERFASDYGFEYLDGAAEEIKNTMYEIEKDLTGFVELQYQPKVLAHSQKIQDFTSSISKDLNLPSEFEPINLPERIIGLLERALIVHNKGDEQYVEGKKGYVNMFDFRDDRGGRINARSEIRSQPIQTSDIFFDTRETISEVKLIDVLWVHWFKEITNDNTDVIELDSVDDDEENDTETDEMIIDNEKKVVKIKTRIASYNGFYRIDFKRYLLKEEYEHVLSLIGSFS